jgi:phage gpG-like protein
MSAWVGDLSELGRLADNLDRLSRVPSRAARKACDGIAEAIEEQFDSGSDSYGKPWADLKPSTIDKGRSPPPLTDSGDMRDSIEVRPAKSAGIQITIGAEYAGFHQAGTSIMAQRTILPVGPLPKTWTRAIDEALDLEFEEAMR